jgi:hypothetical protein
MSNEKNEKKTTQNEEVCKYQYNKKTKIENKIKVF